MIQQNFRNIHFWEVIHPAVKVSVGLMDKDFANETTLEHFGEKTGFNLRYIHRVFSEQMHIYPIHYLNRTRLSHALRLLRETSDTVELIAEQCGFSGASYFSQSFRLPFGMLPSEYQKEG